MIAITYEWGSVSRYAEVYRFAIIEPVCRDSNCQSEEKEKAANASKRQTSQEALIETATALQFEGDQGCMPRRQRLCLACR
ncbi:MAG TPA: hypothetical protein V6C97_03320 [Oculatellaceae cyanobacterium]